MVDALEIQKRQVENDLAAAEQSFLTQNFSRFSPENQAAIAQRHQERIDGLKKQLEGINNAIKNAELEKQQKLIEQSRITEGTKRGQDIIQQPVQQPTQTPARQPSSALSKLLLVAGGLFLLR